MATTVDLIDEIRRNVARFFSRRSPADVFGGDARDFAHYRDCRLLLAEIDRLRTRRPIPTSDDTVAMPTPATAVMALAPRPPDPSDAFVYPGEDATTIGWNACVIAAEGKVDVACSAVVRNGGSAIEARTQSLIAIRGMRRMGM